MFYVFCDFCHPDYDYMEYAEELGILPASVQMACFPSEEEALEFVAMAYDLLDRDPDSDFFPRVEGGEGWSIYEFFLVPEEYM